MHIVSIAMIVLIFMKFIAPSLPIRRSIRVDQGVMPTPRGPLSQVRNDNNILENTWVKKREDIANGIRKLGAGYRQILNN